MGKINLTVLSLFVLSCAGAQSVKKSNMDSIRDALMDEAALKFPRIRQFSISHEEASVGNIRSELHGNDFFKGKLRSSKTTVNLNVPVVEKGKNIIMASFGAMQQHFSLDEVVNYNLPYTVTNANEDMTTFSTGISYIRHDSLFGLPATFNVSVAGLFNQSFSRQRFTYSGLVSFTFLRNRNSSLMGGLVVIKDPSSPVPVFLFLSYYHKFQSLGMELMVDIPSRIAIRKELNHKTSLTAFGDLVGSNSFLDINNATLPQQAVYSSLSIKSGLLLEYRVAKKVVLSCSGGLQSTVTSKLVERGEKSSNYFIKNNNGTVPYVQVGVSLLPFWKLFK